MSDNLNANKIINYIKDLNPKGPLELAKTLNEVGSISQSIINFIEETNASRKVKILEEEKNKLSNEVGDLDQLVNNINLFSEEQRNLISHKKELLDQKNIIENIEKQNQEISDLQGFIQKYNITELRKKTTDLKSNLDGDLDQVITFFDEAQELFSRLNEDVSIELVKLETKLNNTRLQINKVVEKAKDSIKVETLYISEKVKNIDVELDSFIDEYNSVTSQLSSIREKLLELKSSHANNIKSYNIHFSQNKEIWGELGEKHNLEKHLKKLLNNIENDLSLFDREIKHLVEQAEKISIS